MLPAHHAKLSGAIRAVDLLLLAATTLLGGAWPEPPTLTDPRVWVQVGLVVLVWSVVAVHLDVYRSRRTDNSGRELRLLGEGCLLAFATTCLCYFVIYRELPPHAVRTGVAAFLLLALERLAGRALLRGLRRRGYNRRYAVLVGCGRSAEVFADALVRHRHYGIRVLGAIALGGETGDRPRGVRDLTEIGDLERVLSEFVVDVVILCPSPATRAGETLEVLNLCDVAGIPCHYAPSFFSLRRLRPRIVWYGNMPCLAFHRGPHAPIRLAAKRGIDIVCASAAILILSPVLITAALAVWLHDRRSIIFTQTRVGQNGRPFTCFKFRSMSRNAEDRQEELLAINEADGPVFKIRRDPRVTPVGRFLRKYSLDELPQLLNVLKGDMSLVGPRPLMPTEVEQYDWWQRRRLSVRPGITCIWQVFGRNRVPFERWMEMDLQYIDNWSLSLDVKLLARTVGVVLKGTGV